MSTERPVLVDRPPRHSRRPVALIVAAVLAELIGLAAVAFCLFIASLATYGLYSWTEPKLDSAVILPMVGIVLAAPLGPLVMTLGGHRRRWLIIAAVTSAGFLVLASVLTWLPVALGGR